MIQGKWQNILTPELCFPFEKLDKETNFIRASLVYFLNGPSKNKTNMMQGSSLDRYDILSFTTESKNSGPNK